MQASDIEKISTVLGEPVNRIVLKIDVYYQMAQDKKWKHPELIEDYLTYLIIAAKKEASAVKASPMEDAGAWRMARMCSYDASALFDSVYKLLSAGCIPTPENLIKKPVEPQTYKDISAEPWYDEIMEPYRTAAKPKYDGKWLIEIMVVEAVSGESYHITMAVPAEYEMKEANKWARESLELNWNGPDLKLITIVGSIFQYFDEDVDETNDDQLYAFFGDISAEGRMAVPYVDKWYEPDLKEDGSPDIPDSWKGSGPWSDPILAWKEAFRYAQEQGWKMATITPRGK